MKTLKIILILLGVIIAIALIAAIFLPNSYEVQRKIIIKKPANMVFYQIADFKNWEKWSPWNASDKDAKFTFAGQDGKVGSKMMWDGDTIGKGSMTITKIHEFDRIETDLELIHPWSMKSHEFFTFDHGHGNTLLTWYDVGKLSYPLGRIMNLFYNMDKLMGPDFEKGLKNIKALLEKALQISQENMNEKKIYYISLVSTMDPADIQSKIGAAFTELKQFVDQNKLDCIAPPMVITTKYDEQSYSFDAAFEVSRNTTKPNGRIKAGSIPASKIVKGVHVGSYSQMINSYKDMEAYLAKNNLEKNGRPLEIYIDDPAATKPDKLRTEIVYPVK